MSGRAKDGIDVGLSNHAEKMAANIYGAAQDVLFPLVVFPDLSLARGLQTIAMDQCCAISGACGLPLIARRYAQMLGV